MTVLILSFSWHDKLFNSSTVVGTIGMTTTLNPNKLVKSLRVYKINENTQFSMILKAVISNFLRDESAPTSLYVFLYVVYKTKSTNSVATPVFSNIIFYTENN